MKLHDHSVVWVGLAVLTTATVRDVAGFQSLGLSIPRLAQQSRSTKLGANLVFGDEPVPVLGGDSTFETTQFASLPASQLGSRGFQLAVEEGHAAAGLLEENILSLAEEDTVMPDGTVMCNSFIEEYTPEQKAEMGEAMDAYMWFSSLHTSYVNQAAASLTAGNDVTIQGVTYSPVNTGGTDNGLTQNAAKVSGPILRWLYTKIKIAYSLSNLSRQITQKSFSVGISVSFVLSVLETVMLGVSPTTLSAIAKVAAGQSGNLSAKYGSDATDLWMSSMVPVMYWNTVTDRPNMALVQYRITMLKRAWEVVTSCSSTMYQSTTTVVDGLRTGIDIPLLVKIYKMNDKRAEAAEDFLKGNTGGTLSDMDDPGAVLDFS